MSESDKNVADAVFGVANGRPEQPAIEADSDRLTYGELVDAVLRAQSLFDDWGVRPGDRVATAFADQVSEVIAMLASARCGALYLPLDRRTTFQEQIAVFDLCAGVLALTDSPSTKDDRFKRVGPEWWAEGDRAPDEPCGHFGSWAISLSSGTTGTPSGAVVTHASFFQRIAPLDALFHSATPLRYLSVIPLIFSGSRTQALYQLLDGNTLVCYPPLFTPEELVDIIDDKRIDATYVPAAVLRRILALPSDIQRRLSSLEYLVSGAAFLSAEEKRRVLTEACPRHFHAFGVSGVGRIATLLPEDVATRPDSVGRIQTLMEARIQDDGGSVLAPGMVGRLSVRGPTVPTEFFGETPDIDTEGWYGTGDLAAIDGDGYLYLHGRTSDFINRGGMNVYAGLVEQQLAKHPKIVEVTVVGRPAGDQEEEIVAFVVVDESISVNELRDFSRSQLSGSAQPAEFLIVDELPKTAAGKVRRGELRARIIEERMPVVS